MQQNTFSSQSSSAGELCRQLENGLVSAAGKLRAARLRRIVVKAAGRSLQAVSVSLGVGTVLSLVGKALGVSTLVPTLGVISLGIVAGGLWFIAMLWPAVLRGSVWNEAAERLDLAVSDHNAIATALDFAQSGLMSPIADRAIMVGLTAVNTYSAVAPTTAEPDSWPLRSAGVTVIVAGLFFLTCIVPDSAVRSILVLSPAGPGATALRTKLGAPGSQPAEAAPRTSPDSAPSSPATAPPTVGASAAQPAVSSDFATDVSGAGFAAQSTGMASVPAPFRSDPLRRSAPTLTEADVRSPANRSASSKSKSEPTAVGQPGSMDQSPGNGNADGAAAENDSNSNPPQEAADRRDDPSGGSADGAGLLPDDKAKSQAPLDQGNGSHIRTSDARGSSKGSNDQSGDQSGPNGRSGGQNSPKKARGVASLMLGSRQADLVKGRPLPGPDQRTPMELPPVPTPINPAASAAAAASRNLEPATDVFHVSSAERTTVDAYFQNLHAEAPAE